MLISLVLLVLIVPVCTLLYGRFLCRHTSTSNVLCMSVDGAMSRRDNGTLAYNDEDVRLKVPKEFAKVNIPNGVDISMSAVEVKKINEKVEAQSASGMSDLDMLKKAIEDMLNQM